ncbi:hypothetical protein BDY19DRAFT_965412 [Irpex rosettiformis]|uniref:Uncharacterized protein n=1 Tax=Irpex rosettiformis TaxID=378272 RepID=A0ACB8TU89_9APHY|nr:hypothetical protein BDY19DRAFT_965412 [Irpex rosettiformis]
MSASAPHNLRLEQDLPTSGNVKMSDTDRPNWLRRLSSSTTTSLRSLGLHISPSTSPTQSSPSTSPTGYDQGSMKENSTTNSSGTSRQSSSLRHFRPSRQQSSNTSEYSVGNTLPSRPTSDIIRHTGSLQSIMQNGNNNYNHYTRTSTRSNTHSQAHQHQVGSRSRSLRIPPPLRSPQLGPVSSPGFPNSLFYASEFMIGAGMVIIQPSTSRIVIIHETKLNYWFLPKGRKDVGESVEQAALREAYEESGYRAEFLPLYILTNAPTPPGAGSRFVPQRNTEPIYLSTYQWKGPRWPQGPGCIGGEYLTFWFVGQIPHDAVHEAHTGMPDEVNYVSELVDIRTALHRLSDIERNVVQRAFDLWTQDAEYERDLQESIKAEKERAALRRAAARDSLVGNNKPGGDEGGAAYPA